MHEHQSRFIDFMLDVGVLTFGDFTTKSGRKTPYFVNTGLYRSGDQLRELGTTMPLDYLLVSPLSEKTFDLFTERVLPEFV